MKNHLKILCLLISMFIPQPAFTAGKHALLIAIQDYSKTPFNSLKGPVNDVKLTEGVLRERFGFSDNDFIIIKDAQATHTGIEKAFKALIERVQTDDFVYIYYSGHSSQTADLNGDNPSGKDQTWVSYGARTGRDGIDNYDVLDDEINAWLAKLYAKTDHVVFVSESCHSATVSRAVTSHGIRVKAARDHEFVIEQLREDNQYYGLFTWHWVRNLQQVQAGDTWNDVFKRTYAQVTAETFILSPDNSCQKGDNCVWIPESDDSWRWYRKNGPYSLQEMNGRKLNKGELLTFTLDNQSKQDYYCYLINLTPSGAIYSLFPGVWEHMESARLNAGQKRELVEEVVLPMREVGEDIIKVITTSTSPIDVSLLEQSPFVNGGLKGNLNPLEQLLVNAVHGWRGNASIRNDEWATEQVTVEVE
jgi:hypothetical protein